MKKAVIIQGLITPQTLNLVKEAHKFCDDETTIIVATWEGQEEKFSMPENLDRCHVLFLPDPGGGPKVYKQRKSANNYWRMTTGVECALNLLEDIYNYDYGETEDKGIVLKVRSDMKFTTDPFALYRDIPITEEPFSSYLSYKIWAEANRRRNEGGKWSSGAAACSDWVVMGRFEDVRKWCTVDKHIVRTIAPRLKIVERLFLIANYIQATNPKNTDDIIREIQTFTRKKTMKSCPKERKIIKDAIQYASLSLELGMLCLKYPMTRSEILYIDKTDEEKND